MTGFSLGITSDGQYGLDTVGLGVEATTGLTSNQNVVAGVLAVPFCLGQIGLKNSNTTAVNGTASFMAQLKNEKLIPSLSYGYTAGAIYRKSHFFRVKDQKADALFQTNSHYWEVIRLEVMIPRASFRPLRAFRSLTMTQRA